MEKSQNSQLPQLAFIGAGNIATAIISGLLEQGYPQHKLGVTDPFDDQLRPFRERGIETSQQNDTAVLSADVVILCVKPNVMLSVVKSIATSVQKNRPLVISVAAGITLDSLAEWLGDESALVRCMPNTPALVQLGASGLFANPRVSDKQKSWTETILNAIGISLWVDSERQMDTVTAISGSGPAYFFYIIEIMQQLGIDLGLSPESASKLVLQTALGAATMAHQSTENATELRRRVTSPGGTTEAALGSLMEDKLMKVFEKAIKAAESKSVELSQTQNTTVDRDA